MKYNEYNERKQHGSPAFPIQLYHVDATHPQYVMSLHWHKELEIVRVLEGQLDLFVGNVCHRLSAGDVAFVNCKCLHRGEPTDCIYECIVCDLSMMVKKNNELFSAYIEPIGLSDRMISDVLPHTSPSFTAAHRLFEILTKQIPYYELDTMSALFDLFTKLYQGDHIQKRIAAEKNIAQTNRIAELIKWIDHNHAEHITLPLLAGQFGLSPNYICRIFKEYTGKTLMEYVNAVRIEHVCHDLKWGQKNITEAALNNGFNDISYFCKVFKKHVGISAGQYLKENKTAG
ncbi:MAG: helix-turn-helix transcriptional regulator [Clostridia bacterium]|nr:helix-turn-helix transcriptional regulator [Clostridia bacterium]